MTAIIVWNAIVIHLFASAKAISGPQMKSATISATVDAFLPVVRPLVKVLKAGS